MKRIFKKASEKMSEEQLMTSDDRKTVLCTAIVAVMVMTVTALIIFGALAGCQNTEVTTARNIEEVTAI